MRKAIYAGSFDPLTHGHLWVIKAAANLFDELTIAIGENPGKDYFFTTEQRHQHIAHALAEIKLDKKVYIQVIENKFLVKYAEENKIPYLVRGIRGPDDFNFEFAMNQINREMTKNIESVYLIPPSGLAQISSSMVKGLVGPEGWEEAVGKYVPTAVLQDLRESLEKQK